ASDRPADEPSLIGLPAPQGPGNARSRLLLRTERSRGPACGLVPRLDLGPRVDDACGGPEPVVVIPPEVAVAVGGASVAGAVEVGQCRGVRLVRGVAVERGGGVVRDVESRSAAGCIGVVLDEL